MVKVSATARRRAAFRRGWWSENVAAWWLRLQGWRILVRRYKTPVGEVDVIARRGNVLLAVEVKARQTEQEGREAVTSKQQERIRRALEAYLQRYPQHAGCDIRLELIIIRPWKCPLRVGF